MAHSTGDPVAFHLQVTRCILDGCAEVVTISTSCVSDGVVIEYHSIHVLEIHGTCVDVGDCVSGDNATR